MMNTYKNNNKINKKTLSNRLKGLKLYERITVNKLLTKNCKKILTDDFNHLKCLSYFMRILEIYIKNN